MNKLMNIKKYICRTCLQTAIDPERERNAKKKKNVDNAT